MQTECSVDPQQGPRGGEPSGLQVVEGFDGHQCHSQDSGDGQAKKEVRGTKDEGLVPKAAPEKVVKSGPRREPKSFSRERGPWQEKSWCLKRGETLM